MLPAGGSRLIATDILYLKGPISILLSSTLQSQAEQRQKRNIMVNINKLLAYGFLPSELPQSFHSILYGKALGHVTKSLPPQFLPNAKGKFRSAELSKHNLARVNRFRRVLGLPNPIVYYNLASEIARNWTEIEAFLNQSSFSVTRPNPTTNGVKAFGVKAAPPDLPRLRASSRASGRYLLITDIQQFYPSIYTHALPWALHSKPVAKSQRDNKFLGNRLDAWVRYSQDDQTRGIPIGPDTSWVLAEILLTSVDLELEKQIGFLRGFRAIDDYELTFRDRSQAETAIGTLQSVLSNFELQLNEEKTRIIELPFPLDETWPLQLKTFRFSSAPSSQIRDLITYFSLAFELASKYPTASVLRYAIARVSSEAFRSTTWPTYQDLLVQSALAEPGALRYVLSELRKYQQEDHHIDKDRLQELLDQLISRHQPLGHGSEVAWAVWTAITLEISLMESSTDKLTQIEDPLIPLLTLHAESEKLTAGNLDKSRWASLMTPEELWRNNWLLCYEANIKGWLPSVGKKDHVSLDPCFSFLKSNGVSFYNNQALSTKNPRSKSQFSFAQLIGYGI